VIARMPPRRSTRTCSLILCLSESDDVLGAAGYAGPSTKAGAYAIP